MRVFLAATIVGLAAACPNACNGNGVCGASDKCSCHQNWQGPDCSQRTCPFTLAWADTADGTNQAHYYAECGNKGSCDRKSGECICFDGYEGKGCRRSTCPEGCSGHGTCEYVEELAADYQDRRNGPGHKYKTLSCTDNHNCVANTPLTTSNVVARTADTDQTHGFLYQLWDAGKIQGCKCDLGYYGSDCSSRTVPRGDDPLTTVKAEMQKQVIVITPGTTAATDEFFLKFHDPYGGIWVTDTVKRTSAGENADDEVLAEKVQYELRSLPNGVLSDVVVTNLVTATGALATCTRFYDGVQHISAFSQTTDGNFKNSKGTTNMCEGTGTQSFADNTIDLLVTMGNKPGQTGVQYLLEVDMLARGSGHYPVSAGMHSTATVTIAEVNSDANLVNLSELSDCADRGLDDGDGQCECFEGYRGLACEEQEALV